MIGIVWSDDVDVVDDGMLLSEDVDDDDADDLTNLFLYLLRLVAAEGLGSTIWLLVVECVCCSCGCCCGEEVILLCGLCNAFMFGVQCLVLILKLKFESVLNLRNYRKILIGKTIFGLSRDFVVFLDREVYNFILIVDLMTGCSRRRESIDQSNTNTIREKQ